MQIITPGQVRAGTGYCLGYIHGHGVISILRLRLWQNAGKQKNTQFLNIVTLTGCNMGIFFLILSILIIFSVFWSFAAGARLLIFILVLGCLSAYMGRKKKHDLQNSTVSDE